ncbi:hypothetical protein LUCX_324 [Xanthomonas phage vB_XciM_LucasX]|nr:hypothetical protein LUCX_324 [Xanthomonas phage vB_XciM_LucasX]
MFEPKSYLEERLALAEIFQQSLAQTLLAVVPREQRPQIQYLFEHYGRSQQLLRDKEAKRVVGEPVLEEGVAYLDQTKLLEYLKANLGRTYFGTEEETGAPDGSIGTKGFGTKFADWLKSLPDMDKSFAKNMPSGFYSDVSRGAPAPILVLNFGSRLLIAGYHVYLGVFSIYLDHVPADFKWEMEDKRALRGEAVTYFNDIKLGDFETEFLKAMSAQGIGEIKIPQAPAAAEATPETSAE